MAANNGENGGPIYVAMYVATLGKICVFDVSSRADMYGPGCGYSVFVGKLVVSLCNLTFIFRILTFYCIVVLLLLNRS